MGLLWTVGCRGVGGAAIGPRWWGNFNEWWAPVRAKDEAVPAPQHH